MKPVYQVFGLIKTFTGIKASYAAAYSIHSCVSAIVFPIGFMLRLKAILTRFPCVIARFIWGVILCFIAQGIFAPLMGRAFMMDWAPYTLASLISHIMMAVVIAFLQHELAEQPRQL